MEQHKAVPTKTSASPQQEPEAWLVQRATTTLVTRNADEVQMYRDAKPEWERVGWVLDITPLYLHPCSCCATKNVSAQQFADALHLIKRHIKDIRSLEIESKDAKKQSQLLHGYFDHFEQIVDSVLDGNDQSPGEPE